MANKYEVGKLVYVLNHDHNWYVKVMYISKVENKDIYVENLKVNAFNSPCKEIMCLNKDDENKTWSFSKRKIANILIKEL